MNMEMTPAQQKMLDAIKAFKSHHGYAPTIRELGDRLGIKSPNGVQCHLIALEKKGQIKRAGGGRGRSITIVNDDKDKETRRTSCSGRTIRRSHSLARSKLMSLMALLILCSIGAWQVCKWCADIVEWAFGKPSLGDLFCREMNSLRARQSTLEELLEAIEHKAAEDGVNIIIDISFGGQHDKFKPSLN